MVIIVLTACPQGLRGHLTRWLEEIAPGVYCGRINARLREKLWMIVLEMVGSGRAIMAYPSRAVEQGYEYKTHNYDWETVNYDGLTLIRRNKKRTMPAPKAGWSNASKYKKARSHQKRKN